jgi:hypothetical protein
MIHATTIPAPAKISGRRSAAGIRGALLYRAGIGTDVASRLVVELIASSLISEAAAAAATTGAF